VVSKLPYVTLRTVVNMNKSKTPYAVVCHKDLIGVSAVRVCSNQIDANEVAVSFIREQGYKGQGLKESVASDESFERCLNEAKDTLKAHGAYLGFGFDVTVIQIDQGFAVLEEPLSVAEMKRMIEGKEDTYVEGVVVVDLSDIIDNDLEGFLDIISEKLCNSPLLMDSDYSIVGHTANSLLVKVTGDVSGILGNDDDSD